MANELSTSLNTFRFVKGGVDMGLQPVVKNVTVSGANAIRNTASIGTGDETLDLGDIATIGWVFFHNCDATNYITIGPDGSSYPIKLKAGEWGAFRWNGAAIHAKANTGACIMEYFLVED